MVIDFTTTVVEFSVLEAQESAYEQAKKFYGTDNFTLVGVHGKPSGLAYEITFSYEATARYE